MTLSPVATYLAALAGLSTVNIPLAIKLLKGNKTMQPAMQAQVDELTNISGQLAQVIQFKVDAALAQTKADFEADKTAVVDQLQKDHDEAVSALQGQIAGLKQTLGM